MTNRTDAIEQALRDMREAIIDALSLNPRLRAPTKAVFDQRLREATDALNMEEPKTGPGLGWKLSDAARDKITKIAADNVHNAAALQSIVLASLSSPATFAELNEGRASVRGYR